MSEDDEASRRFSLGERTDEYVEMAMDLTKKRKRYFSFHAKALSRRRPALSERPSMDAVDESEERSTVETTAVRAGSNLLTVKNYVEMVRQCLLDTAKTFTDGVRSLRDVESGEAGPEAVQRCPERLRNLLVLWSCFVNRCDLVQALVRAGADVNYVLPYGQPPYGAVHVAALNGCANCLKFLLANGCESASSVDGMTALHFATFTDSTDAVRTLVDHDCKLESTVLHSAVRSRAVACVRMLMFEYGVDANVLDQTGFAPVHVCADHGFADCLDVLLSADGTLVDLPDSQEYTALHLACESGHVECAMLLVKRGADVHSRNAKRQAPVHMAAKAQCVECIELLIGAGADVNARDADDRTPLHSAIAAKALNVCPAVDALLSHQAKVNVQDHYGFTPLHLAAINELPECAESLLAKGGNVGIQTYGGISALNMIVRKVPSCMPAIAKQLDSAVTSSWADGFKRGPEIQIRFKYLLNSYAFGEIDLLKCFQEESQYGLLQHPLCQAFLFLKWKKIRKYYLMRLASLGLFIFLYTLYVLTVLSHECYNAAHLNSSENSTCLQNDSGLGKFLIDNSLVMDVILYLLYLFSLVEVFLKISEISDFKSVHQYSLSLSSLSECLVLISVPCISFHVSNRTFFWQNDVGAFCVLCAWTNLMVKIGQLPWFDTYVAMYTKVQKEFAKLLIAYICLLIGFSVSLCVVFPFSRWFSNPVTGFVKVLVMMAGELDINMLNDDNDKSNNNTLKKSDDDGESNVRLNHLITSKLGAYVVYVALLIFVSIILMNLLVGIAVHDIQGLKKTAGLSKIRCQIELIHYIELFMLRSFWPKSVKRRALVYPSPNRTNMTVKPLNHKQTLPNDIIDAIRVLIKRKKHDIVDDKDTFKIQEILREVRDLRVVVEENQKVLKHLLIDTNKCNV